MMRMDVSRGVALVCSCLWLLSGAAWGQAKDADKKEAEKKDSDKAMMEAMEKAGSPGEAHKALQAMTGSWQAVTRTWMKPGAEPMETKGSSTSKMIYGGRYLLQEFKGDMMGKPFTGTGVMGYNNGKKKYEGIWFDSMSTGIFYYEGTMDAAGKVMTTTGDTIDEMTGKKGKAKMVTRIEGPDKHVFEMYEKGPGGKEFKRMEIVYTRAPAAPAK